MTTPPSKPTPSEMSNTLLPFLTTSLKSFTSSTSPFRILYTHPPTRLPPPSALPLKHLYVLDSSFNPPSKAHAWIAREALLSNSQSAEQETEGEAAGRWEGKRLLLLLATQNADKPTKPAAFEERLVMMVLMARNIYSRLLELEAQRISNGTTASDGSPSLGMFAIDIGVIKQPYFVDKAAAIEESGVYGEKERFEQIHLTGFDTLLRIFDRKYYGEKGLTVLEPFLKRGRVRVVMRPGGSWGELEEQRGWVESVRKGEKEDEGVKREWAERVELVEVGHGEENVAGVSSTRVREGVKKGGWGSVEELVGREVMEWVRERDLYVGDEGKS